MLRIVDEKNRLVHEGNDHEMRIAFEYLTTPVYKLAATRGYKMTDLYDLNTKYWTDEARKAKDFKLVEVDDYPVKLIIEIENGVLVNITSNTNVQYKLVDWDNIKEGDGLNYQFHQPNLVVSEKEFNEILEGKIKIANDYIKTINGD